MVQMFLKRSGAATLLALALALLTEIPNATAQTADQAWAYCNNSNNQYGPEVSIGGCTAVIQNAWADHANMAIALHNRGNAYSAQRDYARAIADYDTAIRFNPQDASVFYSRGNAFYAQREYARAVADRDEAARLDPQNADYQNRRCWDRAMANREFDVARAACDAALGVRPNDAYTFDSRGMVGLKQQRWQDAWNDYDAAARIDATSASYRYGRGIAALRLGRAAEGQADIAAATQLDSQIAATYAGYGVMP
jgi:tetratricopeptide (TPR) repeat protein